VEEREDGWVRVVGFTPSPTTGQLERDTPEDAPWSPPPPGRWRSKLQLGSDGNPLIG